MPFAVSDRVSASVDVGTGNLLVTTTEITLPGISTDVELGLTYNSLALASGSAAPSGAGGLGWSMRLGQDTKLILNSDNSVLYLAPEGRQGLFQPATSTTYTSPAGFKVAMVKTASGWTVTDHASNAVSTFDSAGRLTKITDRNSQATTFTYASGQLTTIVSTRGGSGAKTATLTWSGSTLATIAQTGDDGTLRNSSYTYTGGRLTKVSDPSSKSIRLAYSSAGDLSSITNEDGHYTYFDYDTSHRVISVTQENPAGDAVTRFTYYSSNQTYVADPNNTAPTGGPLTTYTLSSSELVTKVVDPLGRTRDRTYTPFADVATSTNGVGGVTTFGHNATVNGGESLTNVTAPTGATSSASYSNTGAAKFLPSGGTDFQGNAKTFTYDGAGNPLSSANTAATTTASVTYNTDGTVDTSKDPVGNVTDYTENADHQITSIAPATGSTLRNQTLAYDGFGRLYSIDAGVGFGTIYNYDRGDRVKTIKFTDSTPQVVSTFDGEGNVLTRTDASGTTTWTYDAQNRVKTRTATSGGGTLSYDYDKAGNLISKTDGHGTTTYAYDAANQVTQMTTPNGQKTAFAYDNNGKRTDTWFNTNTTHTTFAAHTKTTFDTSGRISRTWTARASNDATKTFDTSYCYSPYVAGQACPSASASTDTGHIRWSVNNLTAARSIYTYDTSNRLTAVSNYGGHDYAYTYDKNSNRTSVKVDGTTTQTLTYNTGNQISSSGYNHDKLGRRTADPAQGTLTYNAPGQMTSRDNGSSGSSSYVWAGADQNELVSTTTGSSTTSYVYGLPDANGVPTIQSFTKNGQLTYIDTDPTGSRIELQGPSGTDYYTLDNQGSPIGLINAAGAITATYTYDPAGKQLTATGTSAATNPYRYTQGLLDENTGWIKHGQRWHDTTTANWTSIDPVDLLLQPDAASRYGYVAGNPINHLDPAGRGCGDDLLAYGGIASFVTGTVEGAEVASGLLVGEVALGPAGLIVGGAFLVGAAAVWAAC
ncbi:RHS repeat-associated core domain-containing protein [Kribbella monticola]|uniref:RHS repeat-associated core domain-containing protein n=1 Tax=Kribbella monticola TaxID=2185285 RepID=UPI0018E57660|nr:RHS repeat-associated core domain-containing protein [Kribbella monticola]